MTTQAPPRLVDVRCPVSGHLLCRASGQGTVVDVRCICKRLIRIEDIYHPRIIADR